VDGVGDPKNHPGALLGVFSVLTLFAHRRLVRAAGAFRRAAWYHKRHPTFADALALVRKELWAQEELTFCGSSAQTDTVKVPRAFVERLTDAVCYAAYWLKSSSTHLGE
jgi:hypothetical protein